MSAKCTEQTNETNEHLNESNNSSQTVTNRGSAHGGKESVRTFNFGEIDRLGQTGECKDL